MAKKKAFALRINEEVYKAIERWAEDEFRSTNGQMVWMLQEMLKKRDVFQRKPLQTGKKIRVWTNSLAII
ncbi:Arc family DNA-binding protein [Aureicoccus marinus]|uniref:Arc family DNA binding domain-containing protein n=1 Tax=Aureicoccus marinus TaxID=754435 RepID=A0A2S7T7R0_9FLAO|nr:Arc family DNA-binding protein [Aureicoccus marinus]PQJ15547.1 Arc family DNA binding domain-containing protein [Aureicoccus marinus]